MASGYDDENNAAHVEMAAAAAAGHDGGVERMIGIQELVDNGLLEVPPIYVRPPHERPCFSPPPDDNPARSAQIPVIDLAHLVTAAAAAAAAAENQYDERSRVVEEIGRACEEWGFFQVINHGIEPHIIQQLRATALQFFAQTAEERMRFHSTRGPLNSINYSTSFNPKAELVREWRDCLGFQRYPGCHDGFQEAPDICKEPLLEYIGLVEVLAEWLYKAIFESLGLDEEYIETKVPKTPLLMMGINYYPPCPDPSLTLGLSSHSDVGCLTILHPSEVLGLQIKKGKSWVPVIPIDPNALVINLADQIEILSNGKYKSIEHRVVTNGKKARMSMACFFGPTKDTIIGPLPKLLHEKNLAFYKPTRFQDYYQNFLNNRLLPNRGTLEFARV